MQKKKKHPNTGNKLLINRRASGKHVGYPEVAESVENEVCKELTTRSASTRGDPLSAGCCDPESPSVLSPQFLPPRPRGLDQSLLLLAPVHQEEGEQ